MTNADRDEFLACLNNCTDSQVQDVLEKELAARRMSYARLAREELARRGLA